MLVSFFMFFDFVLIVSFFSTQMTRIYQDLRRFFMIIFLNFATQGVFINKGLMYNF